MKLLIALAFLLGGCTTVSKADRERAALHMQIGTGYLTNGQYPMALTELLKANELDPNNPGILNNLGLAYYVRGRSKQAEDCFRKAVLADAKYSEGKNNLARVLMDTGRNKEALVLLHAVEGDLTYLFPEKTFSNLGMAYFNLGNYKKADEYLSRSLAIRREDCLTADLYGRTLLEMKRYEPSAQALDQAIEFCRAQKFEEPIYFSAMSYYSLGNREKSRARIEELLKDYPKSKYVSKGKGMLELQE